MIAFTVFGEPKGKGRPRFTRNGRTYTDSNTVSYENLVRYAYLEACGGNPKIHKGSVEVCIKAYFSIPKSESKKNKEKMMSGDIRPTKKPDIDNIIKSVLDGLNGVAYGDDKQVVTVIAMKHYSDIPSVEITIRGD